MSDHLVSQYQCLGHWICSPLHYYLEWYHYCLPGHCLDLVLLGHLFQMYSGLLWVLYFGLKVDQPSLSQCLLSLKTSAEEFHPGYLLVLLNFVKLYLELWLLQPVLSPLR